MSAIVRAERSGASAFLLPVSALFSKDDDPRVWVVDPSSLTVQPVAVKTAGLTDEGVRIVAGLNPGDRVVTAGANMLVAGQKVRLLDGGATR
jgi:multidrug efflux pump subunit AcrA (membrane-fusion protein)